MNIKSMFPIILMVSFLSIIFSCMHKENKIESNSSQLNKTVTAKDIIGNPMYQAISYGGYRQKSREIQPTIAQLKEDMRILSAMNIKVLRTYNTHYQQASNLLKAIHELKQEDPAFEMYVMLGVWIDCENAFSDHPNHEAEDVEANTAEVERAVNMAITHPDIVKIIAVGNEAMVKWAASYFVQPGVILKWVNYLQELKKEGKLSTDLWITSSDNFASWGGGDTIYHTKDLELLMYAVDYISLHTYPMHDTHYNPMFWGIKESERSLPKLKKIELAMARATEYAISQYQTTVDYMKSLGIDKPVHIGETGWASSSNGYYGHNGSKATDEFKEALYYRSIRKWSNDRKISVFYFEAFDEIWKDAKNPGGSENHFGLFTVNGQAKYALWDLVDKGVFHGLNRDDNPIARTYDGKVEKLLEEVEIPPVKKELEAVIQ